MDPPNSGPRFREIIKYGPPAGTIPLVAMALILIAVSIVYEKEELSSALCNEKKTSAIV